MGNFLDTAIEQYNLGISKKKKMTLEDYNEIIMFLEESIKYENLSEADFINAGALFRDVKTKMRDFNFTAQV